MGSGKSTIAKSLYHHTHSLILDSDQIIQNNENLTINEIFSQKRLIYKPIWTFIASLLPLMGNTNTLSKTLKKKA